ncbi:MAG: hypothetical protein HY290_11005 [Planctomycetia bacterium]|nr:hypothetical protein [Planctomycetia bacterium]
MIHRWDVDAARELDQQAIRVDTPNVFSLSVAPQGDEAAVVAAAPAGQPGTVVRRYNLDTGAELTVKGKRPYRESKKDVRQYWGAVYAPQAAGADRQILALHGSRAELYDGAARLVTRTNPHGQVRAVGYSSDGKFMLTAGDDGTIKVWDAASRKKVCQIVNPHGEMPASIQSAVFSPVKQSYEILSAGRDNWARLWSWDGKAAEPTAAKKWKHDSIVRSATFSHDGQRVVCACEDGTAWIWKADDDQQPIGKTPKWDPDKAAQGGHQGPVLTAAFSQTTADWIVTGGEDSLAYVWSVGNQLTLHSILKGHAAAVRCAAFSPDDRRIVTGSGDTFAKLWDPRLPNGGGAAANANDRNARELLNLSRHVRAVTSVAFSPGVGDTVLTASSDGDTVLWLSKPAPAGN